MDVDILRAKHLFSNLGLVVGKRDVGKHWGGTRSSHAAGLEKMVWISIWQLKKSHIRPEGARGSLPKYGFPG